MFWFGSLGEVKIPTTWQHTDSTVPGFEMSPPASNHTVWSTCSMSTTLVDHLFNDERLQWFFFFIFHSWRQWLGWKPQSASWVVGLFSAAREMRQVRGVPIIRLAIASNWTLCEKLVMSMQNAGARYYVVPALLISAPTSFPPHWFTLSHPLVRSNLTLLPLDVLLSSWFLEYRSSSTADQVSSIESHPNSWDRYGMTRDRASPSFWFSLSLPRLFWAPAVRISDGFDRIHSVRSWKKRETEKQEPLSGLSIHPKSIEGQMMLHHTLEPATGHCRSG